MNLNDSQQIRLTVAEKIPQDNNLTDIFNHPDFQDPKKKIPYAVGFDEAGVPYINDISNRNLFAWRK